MCMFASRQGGNKDKETTDRRLFNNLTLSQHYTYFNKEKKVQGLL